MPKITIAQLSTQIKSGEIAPVYYFSGDDSYRKLDFCAKIKTALAPDDFNYMRADGSNVDMGELLSAANTAPVFSARRLIVLNNADKIRKGSNAAAALAQYLALPLESTCLIVLHNDAKKAKKDKTFEAALADICVSVNFDPLAPAQLLAWAGEQLKAHGLSAAPGALETLTDAVGADLTALITEIEKLSLLLDGEAQKTITPGDVLASIGFSKEENPFALSNAVMDMDRALSLKLVDSLLAAGEEPISLLNKISACAVKMQRIKTLAASGMNQYQITSAAGLLPWEGRLVAAAGRYPHPNTLAKAIDKIIEADMTLKSSAAGDGAVLLKGVILTLMAR